jgi:ABC-type sugar transport system substrate-binding protein
MRKVLSRAGLAVLLLIFLGLIGSASGWFNRGADDEVTYLIGVSQPNLIEPWRVQMNDEIQAEVSGHSDMRVIFTDAAGSSGQQINNVKQLVDYGIDLLIISLDDPVALTPTVTEVYKDLPVIVLGRGVTGYDYTLYIGTDNKDIGSKAGEYVRELLGEHGGHVIEIKGLKEAPTVEERSLGFWEAIAGSKGIVLEGSLYGDWLSDKAEDEMAKWLQSRPKVDLVFAHNDAMALGAHRALNKAGYSGVRIIGIDGVEGRNGGVSLLRQGALSGTFTSPTGGKEAVRYALDILNKKKGIPKKVILRSHKLTLSNVDKVKKELDGPLRPVRVIDKAHPLTIGFAQVGTESKFRMAHTNSVISAAKAAGVKLLFENADQDQEKQINSIRNFIRQKVDVIIFSPVVKTGWNQVLKEARAAGIPVILSDREIETKDDLLWTSYIGSDFVEEGRRAARWLLQETGPEVSKVNIVEIQGTLHSDPASGRKQGFEEVVHEDKRFKLLASLQGDFTMEKGYALMKQALAGYGDTIDVVYAHNDDMALGAIRAIEEYGLKPGKDILVISIDATKAAFEAMLAGKLNLAVECNPLLGPQFIKAAEDYMSGKELPIRIITAESMFPQETAKQEISMREY